MTAQYKEMRPQSQRAEEFVRWFLRFNGYFSIENFIVHDPSHTSEGIVGQQTESDILAVRMPYSREEAGPLKIANYCPLVDGSYGKFDVVIAEAKSGNANKPNTVWSNNNQEAVEYILRFVGLCKDDLIKASSILAKTYQCENERYRFRYVVVCREPNKHYSNLGVTYFAFQDLLNFLIGTRAQCWTEANLGVASVRHQWDPMIKRIFEIASCQTPVQERVDRALDVILNSNEERAQE